MPKGQLDSDDGWTVIANGKKSHSATFVRRTERPSTDGTIEQLSAELSSKLKAWQQSTCRSKTIEILRRNQPDNGWQIRKAVCMASGSFSRDNLECRRRTMWQFAIFMDLVKYLQLSSAVEIEVMAQEPMYTPLDTEYLTSQHISVLDSNISSDDDTLGSANDHLGLDTFLFEPFMDMGPGRLQSVLSGGSALYIGSSMQKVFSSRPGPDNGARTRPGIDDTVSKLHQLMQRFRGHYQMYKFPFFETDPNVLEGMQICWRFDKDDP